MKAKRLSALARITLHSASKEAEYTKCTAMTAKRLGTCKYTTQVITKALRWGATDGSAWLAPASVPINR
eukprot:scaffold256266_cov24-Tisochrysis_lutea.AAC.2